MLDVLFFKNDDSDNRLVELMIEDNGEIILRATDWGPLVEKFWNSDDYMCRVLVPSSQLQKLVFALLKDRYMERERAVDELRLFCKENDIEHDWLNWFSTKHPDDE